jgi:hypothetical protein
MRLKASFSLESVNLCVNFLEDQARSCMSLASSRISSLELNSVSLICQFSLISGSWCDGAAMLIIGLQKCL